MSPKHLTTNSVLEKGDHLTEPNDISNRKQMCLITPPVEKKIFHLTGHFHKTQKIHDFYWPLPVVFKS